MNDSKPSEPTAEQLLKLLDVQLTDARRRREAQSAKRGTFGVAAILMIVVGAAIALGVLMYLLNDMRPLSRDPGVVAEER